MLRERKTVHLAFRSHLLKTNLQENPKELNAKRTAKRKAHITFSVEHPLFFAQSWKLRSKIFRCWKIMNKTESQEKRCMCYDKISSTAPTHQYKKQKQCKCIKKKSAHFSGRILGLLLSSDRFWNFKCIKNIKHANIKEFHETPYTLPSMGG